MTAILHTLFMLTCINDFHVLGYNNQNSIDFVQLILVSYDIYFEMHC